MVAKKNDSLESFHLRIRKSQLAQVRNVATERELTVTDILREFIRDGLEGRE